MCINELCVVKKINKQLAEVETPSGKREQVRTFLIEEELKEGDKVIIQAGFVIDKVEENNGNFG